MFKVTVKDDWGSIADEYERDSLEDALNEVKSLVNDDVSVDQIGLWQQIPLDITISVEVKAK